MVPIIRSLPISTSIDKLRYVGLTETCVGVCMPPSSQRIGALGGVGQLLPGVEARVVKANGQPVAVGEPGELLVKTISVPLGYLDNEKA